MQSRRTVAKIGLSGLVALGSSRIPAISAQTPETITMDDMELSYQGMLATSQLPELPKAPDGECAVIMQDANSHSEAIAIIHNAMDETAFINTVSATGLNESGELDDAVPELSLHMPLELEPGDYGLAKVEFPEFFEEYTDITFELEIVSEAEFNPNQVTMPVTQVQLVNPRSGNSLNVAMQNRSQNTLAEDSGFIGVFFTPEGEMAYWFISTFISETDPGEEQWMSHSSTSMVLTESFMIGFSGLVLE